MKRKTHFLILAVSKNTILLSCRKGKIGKSYGNLGCDEQFKIKYEIPVPEKYGKDLCLAARHAFKDFTTKSPKCNKDGEALIKNNYNCFCNVPLIYKHFQYVCRLAKKLK
jgi:hypothetical protein